MLGGGEEGVGTDFFFRAEGRCGGVVFLLFPPACYSASRLLWKVGCGVPCELDDGLFGRTWLDGYMPTCSFFLFFRFVNACWPIVGREFVEKFSCGGRRGGEGGMSDVMDT